MWGFLNCNVGNLMGCGKNVINYYDAGEGDRFLPPYAPMPTAFFFYQQRFHREAGGNDLNRLPSRETFNRIKRLTTMSKRKNIPGQIVLFPGPNSEPSTSSGSQETAVFSAPARAAQPARALVAWPALDSYEVVLSGSYRKDLPGLKATFEELLDLGCTVLSPTNVTAVSEVDGFVYMKGEETEAPDAIESRHLDAIQRAHLMWLHAPAGYIGPTASLEVGFAHAVGVPVFAKDAVNDPAIRSFVEVVPSPSRAIEMLNTNSLPAPRPALKAFQQYYRRVAIQRGYMSEGPRDCLLLMVEEVGELARAIRKKEGLTRHGGSSTSERHELADVFLYVVHMANVLDVDLSKIVQEKELINLQKFLRPQS